MTTCRSNRQHRPEWPGVPPCRQHPPPVLGCHHPAARHSMTMPNPVRPATPLYSSPAHPPPPDVGNPCTPGITLTARDSPPTSSRDSHLPERGRQQPLAQPTALRHPGSRCDIDSHSDCRPFLTLIVAPQRDYRCTSHNAFCQGPGDCSWMMHLPTIDQGLVSRRRPPCVPRLPSHGCVAGSPRIPHRCQIACRIVLPSRPSLAAAR